MRSLTTQKREGDTHLHEIQGLVGAIEWFMVQQQNDVQEVLLHGRETDDERPPKGEREMTCTLKHWFLYHIRQRVN